MMDFGGGGGGERWRYTESIGAALIAVPAVAITLELFVYVPCMYMLCYLIRATLPKPLQILLVVFVVDDDI